MMYPTLILIMTSKKKLTGSFILLNLLITFLSFCNYKQKMNEKKDTVVQKDSFLKKDSIVIKSDDSTTESESWPNTLQERDSLV